MVSKSIRSTVGGAPRGRLLGLGVTLAVAVIPLVLAASPAQASHRAVSLRAEGDVDVTLKDLNSSLTAGGKSDNFTVRLRNNRQFFPVNVHRDIAIKLDGLTADG